MLSERINDELTLVDGDLSDLNIRREKLIDGRSRAIAAEGGLAYLKSQRKVKIRDEKESEFDVVLEDLNEKLYPAEVETEEVETETEDPFKDLPKPEVEMVGEAREEEPERKEADVSNEEKTKESKKKKKLFSTGE